MCHFSIWSGSDGYPAIHDNILPKPYNVLIRLGTASASQYNRIPDIQPHMMAHAACSPQVVQTIIGWS